MQSDAIFFDAGLAVDCCNAKKSLQTYMPVCKVRAFVLSPRLLLATHSRFGPALARESYRPWPVFFSRLFGQAWLIG